MDDTDLISKKELLEETGISYGQLYRWKRKNLIPEEWFIRKSTFTGQETFFPKRLILPRIENILHMKDDLSLDELAGRMTARYANVSLAKHQIEERNIVSSVVMSRFGERGADARYGFDRLLQLYIVDKLLRTGEASLDEAAAASETLSRHLPSYEDGRCDLALLRKMGVSVVLLLPADAALRAEPEAKLAARLGVAACAEELHLKLIGG
ncbi:MAG TPA: YhbD family protein [Paenibacillus sp.]|nr:YhbD family protein [Paenibacillus sp.]